MKIGMNETSAKEWLVKAWHDLSGANILFLKEVCHQEMR